MNEELFPFVPDVGGEPTQRNALTILAAAMSGQPELVAGARTQAWDLCAQEPQALAGTLATWVAAADGLSHFDRATIQADVEVATAMAAREPTECNCCAHWVITIICVVLAGDTASLLHQVRGLQTVAARPGVWVATLLETLAGISAEAVAEQQEAARRAARLN